MLRTFVHAVSRPLGSSIVSSVRATVLKASANLRFYCVSAPPALAPPSSVMSLSGAVLKDGCASDLILRSSAVVVSRNIEWANVLVGFEQANTYDIKNIDGEVVGYIAEEDGLGKSIIRNVAHTHRPFTATIFDAQRQPVLTVQRPFYLVSSSIKIIEPNTQEEIGEATMNWHLWRRRYDFFVNKKQWAHIDSGFLSWQFDVVDKDGKLLARVDKDWTSFPRELFTDGNQYIVHFEHAEGAVRHLNLDERALVLAAAITIDFDYFSRSGGHGLVPPIPIVMGAPGGHSPVPSPGDVPGGAPLPGTTGVDLDRPSDPNISPETAAHGTGDYDLDQPSADPEQFPDESTEQLNDPWAGQSEGGDDSGGGGDGGFFATLKDIFGDSD